MPAFMDALLTGLGKLYLYLRLRRPERVRQALAQRYEGQFRNAGLSLLFDLLMALAVVVLVVLLAAVLYFVAT